MKRSVLNHIPSYAVFLFFSGALFLLFSYFVLKFLPAEIYLLFLSLVPLFCLAYVYINKKISLLPIFVIVSAFLGGIAYLDESFILPGTPFQLLFIFALLVFLIKKIKDFDFEIKLTGFELLVSAFLSFIFFSLIYSSNQEAGFFVAFRITVLFILVFYLVNTLKNIKEIGTALIMVTIVATFLAAFSFVQSVLNPDVAAANLLLMGRGIASRAALSDADPNFFATTFFIPLAFTAAIAHSKVDSKYRLLAVLFFLILMGGVASTYSRSAWVAVFFILICIIAYYRNVKIIALVIILSISVLILKPDLWGTLSGVFSRIADIFSGSSDASSKMRIVLGSVGLRIFAENFILGSGFRSFPIEFDRFNQTFGMGEVNEPHNITYQILAELGIIGFFLFALIIYFIIRMCIKNIKLSGLNNLHQIISITLMASLIGYLFFHQFIPRFFTNTTLYVNIALILIQNRYLLTNRENN